MTGSHTSESSDDKRFLGDKIDKSISFSDALEYYTPWGQTIVPQWLQCYLVLTVDPSNRDTPIKLQNGDVYLMTGGSISLR